MKAIAMTLALAAAALAVIATAVFGLGDRRTFVSPPEAVVEGVVRALQRRRFPQSLTHFTAAARARVSEEQLSQATQGLEARNGRIEDVAGEEGWMAGDEAEAIGVLRTDRREDVRIPLRLRREKGEWRLTGIEGLAR